MLSDHPCNLNDDAKLRTLLVCTFEYKETCRAPSCDKLCGPLRLRNVQFLEPSFMPSTCEPCNSFGIAGVCTCNCFLIDRCYDLFADDVPPHIYIYISKLLWQTVWGEYV